MDVGDLVLISVDDHVIEPRDMFEGRVPARYADRAPRIETDAEGHEFWVYEGRTLPNIGLGAVAGRPNTEWGLSRRASTRCAPAATWSTTAYATWTSRA